MMNKDDFEIEIDIPADQTLREAGIIADPGVINVNGDKRQIGTHIPQFRRSNVSPEQAILLFKGITGLTGL